MDQKSCAGVTCRDAVFALINGLIFAAFLPLIIESFGANIPNSWQLLAFLVFPILTIIGVIVGKFLSKYIGFMFQLSKFGIVGGSNTAVDLGILQLLIILSGVSGGLVVSGFKAISFVAAVINSYLWNKHWSFEKKESEDTSKEFTQFVLVSIVGLVINAVAFTVIFNLGPALGFAFEGLETVAGLISTVVVLAWNFVGYKYIVFKK